MKIHWYCPPDINSGMPWSDEWLERNGLGGAETEVVLLSREMSKQGHDVTVYVTNPFKEGKNEYGVTWLTQTRFDPYEDRDVFILHRSWMGTKGMFAKLKAKVKIYFSCDQYTSGGTSSREQEIYPFMDCMFFISPYHHHYSNLHAGTNKLKANQYFITDLGIVKQDYAGDYEKDPYGLIFCSVPLRGLDYMLPIMNRVWTRIPEATLTITADYRLWGTPNPGNEQHREMFRGNPRVRFLGRIPRRELVEEQKKAQIMAYSCIYDENFCIAAAECMAAGVVPVTSKLGALETTIKDQETGILISGLPSMIEYQDTMANEIVNLLTNRERLEALRKAGKKLSDKYDVSVIVKKWIDKFEEIGRSKNDTR